MQSLLGITLQQIVTDCRIVWYARKIGEKTGEGEVALSF